MKIGIHHRWIYGALIVALGAGAVCKHAFAGGGCCGGGKEATAEESKKEAGDQQKPLASAALYPLDTCPLSGKKLNAEGDPVIYEYKGRELRFSSKGCVQAFMKDPEGSLARIDAAIIAQQLPTYPMTACPVSGDKLGGKMGEPVDVVFRNRLVRLCCRMCLPELAKDPARYMAKLDEAVVDKQKPSYPLATCPVSGDKLGGKMGEPIDYVFGTRLVRFCCKGCLKDFQKDPSKFIAKIDEASRPGRKEGASREKPAGGENAPAVFTCPMHPEVVSDRAGSCPKCGMALVKKTAGAGEGSGHGHEGAGHGEHGQ